MYKNVASQKVQLFAFDTATGAPKTGDAANLTAYVSIDGGAVTALTDTSAAEQSSTNAPGVYIFDVSQAETNGNDLTFSAKSSTSGIAVVPRFVTTNPNRFGSMVIDAAGLVDATAVKLGPTGAATAQTARDIGTSVLLSSGTGTGQVSLTSGIPAANVTQWSGTAVATPDTAGYPKVTIKVGTGTGEINLSSGSVPIRTGLKKGSALAKFSFQMVNSSGTPLTGLSPAVTRAGDGAVTFTTVGTATEMASGWYYIDLSTSDTNFTVLALRMTASGAADQGITLIFEP